MGYDKFESFIYKNLSNKSYDIINPIKNIEGAVISKYVYYDINFIVYKCINNIEENINNIIKILNIIDKNKEQNIKNKIKKNKISNYVNFNIIYKFSNIDQRIFIFKKELEKNLNIIIYDEILNYILFSLYSINKPYFIKYVLLFFDGIPSYSKILEQRKRRIFNYLNSKNKKKNYKKYFNENIDHCDYDKELDIKYNYINYIKNIYSINKNFGPQSDFLLNLEDYLKNKINTNNKISLIINNGKYPGEADYKILKHIEENNIIGDISIHSCDSDFLYFLILYQLKNENNYINLNLIKYNNSTYYVYNGKKLINLFLNKYKNDNLINDYSININFLYDILFIIQMFGNDLIPESFEISGDINLSIYFNCHYKLYKNNNFIININDKKTINFNNLSIFLKELKNFNLFSINILTKYFKIPKRIINIICINLNYDINSFITKLIIPYLKYEASIYRNNLDQDDIRYQYIDLKDSKILNNPLNDLPLNKENLLYLKKNFNSIFDYFNIQDYGLIKLTVNYGLSNNPYESLYNYILNISSINTNNFMNTFNFQKNIKESYNNYLKLTKNIDVKNYFDIIFTQTNILFYDFNNYNSECKIFCKYFLAPSISNIIDFIDNNDYYQLEKQKYNKLYFNTDSHLLFITPYLLDNPIFIDNKYKYLVNIMNIMNYKIDNIFNINTLNLRNINPDLFLINLYQLINLFNDHTIQLLYKNKNIIL